MKTFENDAPIIRGFCEIRRRVAKVRLKLRPPANEATLGRMQAEEVSHPWDDRYHIGSTLVPEVDGFSRFGTEISLITKNRHH